MKHLTHLEKLVLSSAIRGRSRIFDLYRDTEIPPEVIHNIVESLKNKDLVLTKGDRVFPRVSSAHSSLWETSKEEAMEVISQAFQKPKSFSLKTVSLTQRDETEYRHLENRLFSFLDECEKHNQHLPMKEQRYVFWGNLSQQDMLTSLYL